MRKNLNVRKEKNMAGKGKGKLINEEKNLKRWRRFYLFVKKLKNLFKFKTFSCHHEHMRKRKGME